MPNNETHVDRYKKYTAVQLRSWLEKLNQKTTGTKAELILRLLSVSETQRGEFPPLQAKELQPDDDVNNSDDSEIYTDSVSEVALLMAKRGKENDSTQIDERQQTNERTKERTKGINNERQVYAEETADDDDIPVEANLEQMKREIKLLRKEVQLYAKERTIMKKEIEILKSEKHSTNDSVGNASVSALKDMLPIFNGECFVHWETQFRNLIETYKLDDKSARILISSRLSGNALKWFHSKTDYAQISINQLMKEMGEMFVSNESRLSLKRAFDSRIWQPVETFQNYFHEKIIMANKLGITEEEEIVENLVDGIPNTQLRAQARMQCFATRQQLAESFRQIELPKARVAPINLGPSTSRGFASTMKQEPKATRCYNCNSIGHYASECRKPRRLPGACHVCGQLGHLAAVCPDRKALQRKAIHQVEDDDEEYEY